MGLAARHRMSFAQPFHDYEILDRVGAGAMGTVFKARHKKLNRIVALKVLRPSLARDERYVDRLRREARIVAALNHPNIVTGYDLGEEGGYHFFVMEFIEGRSLSALLAEWGIFPEDQVLRVAMQVALALDHAFQRNVIHRDVKPGNIIIDEAGVVKLTDMGLAKGPTDLTLTRDGATVGTPQYISPEQAKNPQDVDIRSDLYSLGATLYHMATGQPPFKGDSMAEVITQVLNEVPIAPRVINRSLSEGLALVIRKLLAKNLRLRYQTPRELLDDLERVRDEKPPQVDESRLTAGETDREPSVIKWSLAIVVAAALLAGAVWLGTQLGVERTVRSQPEAWLAGLRAELQGLSSPGQRLQRLHLAAKEAPLGTGPAVDQLQRLVVAVLQQSVDALAIDLRGNAWPGIESFVLDTKRWPGADEVQRERVDRRLVEATGLLREQLPNGVDVGALDAVAADIARLVERRDRALLDRAQNCVDVVLPARADERLRQGDFAAAERVWSEGYAWFFDGLRQPVAERLPAALRAPLQQRFQQAQVAGAGQVAAAEARVASALEREATESLLGLRRRLGAGDPPIELQQATTALRDQLLRAYPGSARFQPAVDPWPLIHAQVQALERDLAMVQKDRQRHVAELLLDLAWRALCDGNAEAGLAVLGDPTADEPLLAPLLDAHRAALHSAQVVAAAVLQALRASKPPLPGYPRNGGLTAELRVDGDGKLLAQVAGGSWRGAQLSEFRFGDLWQRAEAAAPELLAAIPAVERERGRLVLAMAGDDLELIGHGVAATDQAFLRDEVWPRLLRVRGEQRGGAVDRALAFRRLRDTFERARNQPTAGNSHDLEVALATWRAGFGAEASAGEAALAASVDGWIGREQVRQTRLAELQRQVPADASIALEYAGAALCAEISLPPSALRGAGEGWQLRHGRIEYGCVAPIWNDIDRRRLEVDAGLTTAAGQMAAEIDCVLPPADRGPRVYVVAFRGVSCVLVATADDRLFGALVDGDGRRAPAVQAAERRALLAATERGGIVARVLPGGVQRLVIAVECSPGRRYGSVRVTLDEIELCEGHVEIEPSQVPTLVLHPLQDIAVAQVLLRAMEQ